MNQLYSFSAFDHAVMLSDQIRLELFRAAIRNQVKEGMSVVEIGTGTGILSAYAANQTKGTITAIEYDETRAGMARAMFKAAGFKQIEVAQAKSHDVTIETKPQVLITETIGALGPEENIVEICYDFKKRHPSIAKIIPARLKVYAEPIRSHSVKFFERDFFSSYASASFGTFNYETIRAELSKIWAARIRFGSLSDAETVGDRILLADYVLGEDRFSAFEKTIDASDFSSADAIHLYFEAKLDDEVLLSTHYSEPETHWGNAYVRKLDGQKKLMVSYSNQDPDMLVRWINFSD